MSSQQYTEFQLSRLKELLVICQKALNQGNLNYEQANNSYQVCRTNHEKLEAAQRKFDLIQAELNKQLQLIGQFVNSIRGRTMSFTGSLEILKNNNDNTTKGIDQVFEHLRDKKVDSAIAENKTLFDFVDTDSVENLRKQAIQHINHLKQVREASQQISSEIESKYETIWKNSRNMTSTYQVAANFTEKLNVQINEINSISYILVSVAAHHDRLNNIFDNKGAAVVDVPTFERRIESEIPALLSKIRDSLQRIEQISAESESKIQMYSGVYRNALSILNQLENFGTEVKGRLSDVDSLELSFEHKKEEAFVLFEELNNLITWYNLFYTAYEELLFEIIRRQKELRKQREIIDACQRELNSLWKTEEQKRESFFDFYGKYLPQTLCPVIYEPTPRFRVLAERPTSDLPNITESERSLRLSSDSHSGSSMGRASLQTSNPNDLRGSSSSSSMVLSSSGPQKKP